MEHTDIKHNTFGRMVVFQPSVTVGMKKEDLVQAPASLFDDVMASVMQIQGLVHVATLDWQSGDIIKVARCGGKLAMAELFDRGYPTNDYSYVREAAEKVRFTCSNPDCGLDMAPKVTLASLKGAALHMFLKQMAPDYKSVNFTNPIVVERNDAYWNHQQIGDEGWETARKIGTIPLLGKALWGVERNLYRNELFAYRDYDLGLLAVEGLNTSNGCDGLDRWLQYLVCKLQRSLSDLITGMLPFAIGPKKIL